MSEDAVTDLTRGVYRRLYSGFIKGQRINKLSLQAEAWFWRVFAVADDFGNYDADPELVKDATKGRRKVTTSQVERWLNEMESVGLISFYHDRAERYLHIYKFEITQPAGKNGKRLKRFPLPGESDGIQVNPDSSSASDNDPHSDNHNDTKISLVEQARRVFRFWAEFMKHPKAALDAKREKAITARLRDGYSVDDLILAVKGCKLTPHNMGKNDRNQVYDDIELICRDAAHVDRFIRNASAENGARPSPRPETVRDQLLRESCEDCHGTGTKIIRGKGATRCEHTNAVIKPSGDSVRSTPQDSEVRVS